MKKLLALILALITALSCFACGGTSDPDDTGNNQSGIKNVYNVKGDNKTTINFKNYGGAYGTKWIEIAAEQFAELHKDTKFEPGKKGVYIDIVSDFNYALETMNSSDRHIIMHGLNNATQYATYMYNINDLVKNDTTYGATIDSRILDGKKARVQHNEEYYAVPFMESYGGISYNHKLFASKGAFFADASKADNDNVFKFACKFSAQGYEYFTADTTCFSKGPDGQAGTADDGMPVSLEQFLVLCEYLQTCGVAPLGVSGKYQNYSQQLAVGLFPSLAGYDKMNSYYNATGTVDIVEVDGTNRVTLTEENLLPGVDYLKKPKTRTANLTANDGYLATQMVEKYYSIALYEILEKEGYWSKDSIDPKVDHYGAQSAFLTGTAGGYMDNVAMLVESSYWYNEGKDAGVLKSMEYTNGETEETIDVRYMALPSAITTAEASFKPTSLCCGTMSLFINGNVKGKSVENAVLSFFKFLMSEEQCKQSTIITGFPIGLTYDVGDFTCTALGTTYKMSNFHKSIWNIRKTDGSNLIEQCTASATSKLNVNSLILGLTYTSLQVKGTKNLKATVATYGVDDCFLDCRITSSGWQVPSN